MKKSLIFCLILALLAAVFCACGEEELSQDEVEQIVSDLESEAEARIAREAEEKENEKNAGLDWNKDKEEKIEIVQPPKQSENNGKSTGGQTKSEKTADKPESLPTGENSVQSLQINELPPVMEEE